MVWQESARARRVKTKSCIGSDTPCVWLSVIESACADCLAVVAAPALMAGGTPHVCLVCCRHATTPTTPATTTPSARRQRPSVTSQHKCGLSQSPQARMLVERLSHHSVSCNLERPTMRCVASWHPLTARAARAAGVASEAHRAPVQSAGLDSRQQSLTTQPAPAHQSHTALVSLLGTSRVPYQRWCGTVTRQSCAQATPSLPLSTGERAKEGDLLCHSPKRLKHSTKGVFNFYPRNPSKARGEHLVWSQRVARGRGLSAGGGPQPRSHVEEASVRGMAPPTHPARCRKCRCFQSFCGRDTKARWLFLPLQITLRARTQHRGG